MMRVSDECPKCGLGTMRGPTYCSRPMCPSALNGFGVSGEHLHYQCIQCGYRSAVATVDSQRNAEQLFQIEQVESLALNAVSGHNPSNAQHRYRCSICRSLR